MNEFSMILSPIDDISLSHINPVSCQSSVNWCVALVKFCTRISRLCNYRKYYSLVVISARTTETQCPRMAKPCEKWFSAKGCMWFLSKAWSSIGMDFIGWAFPEMPIDIIPPYAIQFHRIACCLPLGCGRMAGQSREPVDSYSIMLFEHGTCYI